jgi:hypothetical protein
MRTGYAASGVLLPTLANYAVYVGGREMPTERQLDMSGKEQEVKSLSDMPTVMRSGEEPTELLLQLAWSPIETLLSRDKVKIFVGNGAVAVFFYDTTLTPNLGLVPTEKESVGNA